jgi:hypothetical protein
MGNTYWANEDPDKLAEIVGQRVTEYHRHLEMSGRSALYRRAARLYYGLDPELGWKNSAAVTYGGEQGELSMIRVNLFRSLLENLMVIVTGDRPSFSARAINSDYESQAQADLAEGLVQYYLSERGFEDRFRDLAEFALLYGEGWLYLGWDVHAGEEYGVEDIEGDNGLLTQKVLRTGDVDMRCLDPFDLIRDPYVHFGNHQWYAPHIRMNKWELAATYPEHAEHILQQPTLSAQAIGGRDDRGATHARDEISTYRFLHARSMAMPRGRNMLIVGDKALSDGPLGYKDLPLIPLAPSIETRTAFGYSRMWDLMALQEGLDSVISTLLTNHDAFGVQNVWTPKGSDLTVDDLSGGLKHWESHEKPESINLLESSPDSYRLAEIVTNFMQELVGLNEVARGHSAENVKSAQHAALLYSAAIQFNSNLQKGYVRLQERAATHLVRVLQMFAQAPQIAEIAGHSARPLIREFKGSDLSDIHRVTVDVGPPIQRSLAGKLETAQMLVALSNTRNAEPITPKQLFEVVATGRLEPMMRHPESQRRLIEKENEMLMDGEPVRTVITDEHAMHIRDHSCLLNDPTVRDNNDLVALITQHVQEHIDLWVNADPNILAAMGQAPPQLPPPVAGALASGAIPEGSPAPGVNPGATSVPGTEGQLPQLPPEIDGAGVSLPQPPIDPATGQPLA